MKKLFTLLVLLFPIVIVEQITETLQNTKETTGSYIFKAVTDSRKSEIHQTNTSIA